jgi:formate hydrogenlyase subunit 6/NADH:ubiquinone oxidoreductase subunit I
MDFPFVREAVTKLFSKPSCAMYPFEPSEAAPNYRGRIVFHPETCINCNMCERVCAGGAITHTSVKNEDGDDVVTRSFDLGSCTFCATCADFCTRHSIELTQDYHMIGIEEGDLIVSGTFVKKAVKKPAPKPAAAEKKADAPAAAPKAAAPAAEAKAEAPAAPAPEAAPAAAPKAKKKAAK